MKFYKSVSEPFKCKYLLLCIMNSILHLLLASYTLSYKLKVIIVKIKRFMKHLKGGVELLKIS